MPNSIMDSLWELWILVSLFIVGEFMLLLFILGLISLYVLGTLIAIYYFVRGVCSLWRKAKGLFFYFKVNYILYSHSLAQRILEFFNEMGY